MGSYRGNDGGLPRRQRSTARPPGGVSTEEDLRGANQAKTEKLRRKNLQRLARARGLELRHSAYGYALIDLARKRVDDRQDMTLDDVEACLARG
jgi:hypothetical protein